jgi:hypothetical protein
MSTIDDIIAEKNAAVAILDQKIIQAGNYRNQGVAGMDAALNDLMAEQQAVYQQALNAALSSPELARALSAIKGATASMTATAAIMTSVASFIAHVADILGQANQVVSALGGGAGPNAGN